MQSIGRAAWIWPQFAHESAVEKRLPTSWQGGLPRPRAALTDWQPLGWAEPIGDQCFCVLAGPSRPLPPGGGAIVDFGGGFPGAAAVGGGVGCADALALSDALAEAVVGVVGVGGVVAVGFVSVAVGFIATETALELGRPCVSGALRVTMMSRAIAASAPTPPLSTAMSFSLRT
jgi:hypothetical protein